MISCRPSFKGVAVIKSSACRNQSGADSGQEMNEAVGLGDKGEFELVANV
jgi:hypothetical protein